jgi:hypothetical protein
MRKVKKKIIKKKIGFSVKKSVNELKVAQLRAMQDYFKIKNEEIGQ